MTDLFTEEYDVDDFSLEEIEKSIIKESKTKLFLDVSIDSEFNSELFISLQVSVRFRYNNVSYNQTFVLLDVSVESFFSNDLISTITNETQCQISFIHLNLNQPLLADLLSTFLFDVVGLRDDSLNISVNLYFFYSMKDLILALSKDYLKPYLLGQKAGLKQRRSISGYLIQNNYFIRKNENLELTQYQYTYFYKLKDIFGTDSGSLAKVAQSCGIEVDDKNTLDSYKENMIEACKEEPYLFLKYAIFDTQVLFQIIDSKIESANKVLINTFHIYDQRALYNKDNYPCTIGSYVVSLWKRYFDYSVLKDHPLFNLISVKQSMLKPQANEKKQVLEMFKELNKIHNLEQLKKMQSSDDFLFKKMTKILNPKEICAYLPHTMLSPQFLVQSSAQTNAYKLALIQGGRAVNERCKEYSFSYVADIDMASAYGSRLLEAIYPIGRPRLYIRTNNQEGIKLGDFYSKYGDILIDGLYKIVISGKLSFEQDLIFSKLVNIKSFTERFKKSLFLEYIDESDVFSDAPLVLLTKEIKNGIITSHTWSILKATCSTKEFSEICNLNVDAAAFYTKNDQVNSLDELLDTWLKDKGKYEFNFSIQNSLDNRTHAWYALPLSSFIGPILSDRKRLKKSKDPQDQATQNTLKLIINTMYGVLCSRFFPELANVICADNITSAVRSNAWLMSRALNSFQSITDGGGYCLTEVIFLKKTLSSFRKPSFEYLCDLTKLRSHRYVQIGNLGNIPWKDYIETNKSYNDHPFELLDDKAKEHIVTFWAFYNLLINFDIEHKKTNIAKKAATIRKADYAFLIYDENTLAYTQEHYKLRGAKMEKNLEPNPAFGILKAILCGNDNLNFPKNYQQTKSIKLSGWRKELQDPEDIDSYKPQKGLLPGDFYVTDRTFVLNNTFIRISNERMYRNIINRKTKKNKRLDDGTMVTTEIDLFEQFIITEGIAKTYKRMNDNNLRNQKYKNKKSL